MNAHISKPVEMEVLKKTIKSIKISGFFFEEGGTNTD